MEQTNTRSRFVLIIIVTALLVWSFQAWGIKLGQDLEGGTTLRFSLDIEGGIEAGRLDPMTPSQREVFVDSVIEVIEKRINAHGVAEITLTPVGENKFEISLPTGMETESIVEVVTTLGNLQFRIEVLPQYNFDADDNPKRTKVWTGTEQEFNDFKAREFQAWKDAKSRGVQYKSSDPRFYIVKNAAYPGTEVGHFHVLEQPPKQFRFDGKMLKNPRVGQDQFGKAVVNFDVKGKYQNEFGQWTEQNIALPMAIVLNEEYDTAPRINSKLTDNVQITLGETNFEEAEKKARALATVLETGALDIRPKLESRATMGASLAGQSRDRGILAVLVAFGLVLIFMMVYYRGAGIVANIALLLNLVLLVGFLAFFQAVLTLPGIAGIVLTVGMAVDANILINERIREERRAGRTLRRALSEGYARALSAIIDANVTSVITAIFLYAYGSGTIKGFAVTLGIGLLVSMFTAIFVTRTIFEWRLRQGGLQKLGTYGSKTIPTISWLALRRMFAPISVILVVIGLAIFAMTERNTLYDVDFTGGYKLQIQTKDALTVDEVKQRLATQVRKVEVSDEVETEDGIETRKFADELGPYDDAQVLEVIGKRPSVEITVQALFDDIPDDQREQMEPVRARQFEQYVGSVFDAELLPHWLLSEPVKYTKTGDDDPLANVDGAQTFAVAFDDPADVLTAADLRDLLETKFPYFTYQGSKRSRNDPANITGLVRTVEVRDGESPAPGLKAFDVWFKSRQDDSDSFEISDRLMKNLGEFMGGKEFRDLLKERLGEGGGDTSKLGLSRPFPSQDQIGSAPAERAKNNAIIALLLSLIGIIIYIAIRFNSRAMGFAAVFCLFHDVAICLGLVALANSLGLVDAKINLAMVAAFLTLVGYSVNDTVVIFDRIRENRGKNPRITPEVIDLSINQTLARTIRTSLTFLLVCLALFGLNLGQRNVLEGFAFLLILGSIIGTYSTIAIASPLLLYLPWLWERIKGIAPNNDLVTKCAQSAALLLALPVAAILWAVWGLAFVVIALIAGLVMFPMWAMGEELTGERKSEVAPAR